MWTKNEREDQRTLEQLRELPENHRLKLADFLWCCISHRKLCTLHADFPSISSLIFYLWTYLSYTVPTHTTHTQDMIDTKCEKRRKGIYGPPVGQEFLIFIDDVNMPLKELYGAQPSIELLRQWFDSGGWYDRKTLDMRKILGEPVVFIFFDMFICMDVSLCVLMNVFTSLSRNLFHSS